MAFCMIDYDAWNRREIYEHFKGTTMYTTVHMDITKLVRNVKDGGLRLYPTLIHCISSIANTCSDYRYGLDEDGNIGIYDCIHPLYTVPRKGNPRLFSMAVTEYQPDFEGFYNSWLHDYARAEVCDRLMSDPLRPNLIGITAMPGTHFSSFAFGDSEGKQDLTPFILIGKYEKKDGKLLLPVFGEFEHSVNDGYHISQFFDMLQKRFDGFGGVV